MTWILSPIFTSYCIWSFGHFIHDCQNSLFISSLNKENYISVQYLISLGLKGKQWNKASKLYVFKTGFHSVIGWMHEICE